MPDMRIENGRLKIHEPGYGVTGVVDDKRFYYSNAFIGHFSLGIALSAARQEILAHFAHFHSTTYYAIKCLIFPAKKGRAARIFASTACKTGKISLNITPHRFPRGNDDHRILIISPKRTKNSATSAGILVFLPSKSIRDVICRFSSSSCNSRGVSIGMF